MVRISVPEVLSCYCCTEYNDKHETSMNFSCTWLVNEYQSRGSRIMDHRICWGSLSPAVCGSSSDWVTILILNAQIYEKTVFLKLFSKTLPGFYHLFFPAHTLKKIILFQWTHEQAKKNFGPQNFICIFFMSQAVHRSISDLVPQF